MKRIRQIDVRKVVAGIFELADGREIPVAPLDAVCYQAAVALEKGEIAGDEAPATLLKIAKRVVAPEWHETLDGFQIGELVAIAAIAGDLVAQAEQANPNMGNGHGPAETNPLG